MADLALGLRVLSTLLESGLPVGRAVTVFEDVAPSSWRSAISPLRAALREGRSLADGLAAAPLDVPPVTLGIVRAGEAGSGLPQAVRRAADLAETDAKTRAAVRAALAYPSILAVAGAGSVALLVGLLLPRFAEILSDLGQGLPPATRLVLRSSEVVRVGTLPAIAAAVAVAALWRAWVSSERGRSRWHELLLRTPLLGAYRHAAATARVTGALSALLASGVPIAVALAHAAAAAGDAAAEARLGAAREIVVGGSRVARAFAAHEAVTPTAVKLVAAGEESGRLAEMLEHAARLEGEHAAEMVRSAVRLLEPALILAFGGVIALVAAALLQAVYAVRPTP